LEVGPISALHAIAPPPRRAPLPGTAQARSPRVQRLFRRYARFGDLAARDELFERFLPLARGLARRYHRGTEPLDDLVQVASIGLLNAINRFDPERGREFTTFAIPTIVGELKRYSDGEPCTLGESIGGEDPTLELVECRDVVTRSVRELSKREQRVLHLRFVEDMTQSEIGDRIGVSQMQVSRILRTALERSRATAAAGPDPV